jgi:hypothetical protein
MPIRQLEFTSAYCAALSRSYLQVFALSKLQHTQQLLCAHSHMHKPLIMDTSTCAHSPMPLIMYTCYRVQGDIQSRRQAVATAAPPRLQGWISNCALGNWHCQVVHKTAHQMQHAGQRHHWINWIQKLAQTEHTTPCMHATLYAASLHQHRLSLSNRGA